MSHAEVFATRIKIESSDQSHFEIWSKDQDDIWIVESTKMNLQLQFKLWTPLRASEENNQVIKHTFSAQKVLMQTLQPTGDT